MGVSKTNERLSAKLRNNHDVKREKQHNRILGLHQHHRHFIVCIKLTEGQSSKSCTKRKQMELECGPMPKVMVALPNIGGALCSTPQSLADAQY